MLVLSSCSCRTPDVNVSQFYIFSSASALEIADEYHEEGISKEHSPVREFPYAIRCYMKMEKALREQKE
jgi:hypothetical protein